MAYRNGTYIAFHADGTNEVGKSDLKYYNLIKAWTAKTDDSFSFIDSHDKASSVRDSSKKETLRRSLIQRLSNSKNMVLIIGDTTKNDTDWVPFEIEQAIDKYQLPIIAAYTGYNHIMKPADLGHLWPKSLATRISSKAAKIIHIPFKQEALSTAIAQYSVHKENSLGPLSYYSKAVYLKWGYMG